MRSNEIRQTFLKYFADRGHRIVKSSSLVPANDPTLLFTNAGMNQFKDVFLGLERRDYARAASCQKCLRAGGKHNDLENVGRTARHHTFFEMLGNFSFGDYFKREAIAYAWELVTKEFGLSRDSLYVTIFEEDDEAHDIWRNCIGVRSDRIFRLGEKDNFWAMGDTGPCGPCSEIHYDLGRSPLGGHADCSFPCECGRYVEIWNLVFMQYNRDERGRIAPLPRPSIDTGMGLERIAAVLQGKLSNYETDLFTPLIEAACDLTLKEYGADPEEDISLRILADHSRAAAFIITDGVLPSNEGRGYVLRRIIRRALRHGRKLGLDGPFLYKLTGIVADIMKEAYPELIPARDYVARVVKGEEEKFASTLTYGLRVLDDLFAAADKREERSISGQEIFKLYDTYGFPLDLAREIAEERGFAIDEAGFYAEMRKQRERAKASWKGAERKVGEIYLDLSRRLSSRFIGYQALKTEDAVVLAIIVDNELRDEIRAGQAGEVVLDVTPFYAEAGGQVGDQGLITASGGLLRVFDTQAPAANLISHKVRCESGQVRVGDKVIASVDEEKRRSTMRNHTGTHLLHAALREVLGEHVKQAGSLVAPDRLRFDFTHFAPLSEKELERIEELVNEQIQLDRPVFTEVMDLEQALASGALAFFGDKYTERVRVVSIDHFSKELCGGTHVRHTGEIGLLKIISESSIAAGVRRVEALTGEAALQRLRQDEQIISELCQILKAPRHELPEVVERLAGNLKEAQKEIETLKLKLAEREAASLIAHARDIAGIKVLSHKVENIDRAGLRNLADRLRDRLRSGVIVLGAPQDDGKAALVAMVSSDLVARVQANWILKQVAPIVGGGGGGKADLAEAGGKDSSRLEEALAKVYQLVEQAIVKNA